MTIYEFKNNWNLVNLDPYPLLNPFNWKIPVHLILWYLGNLPNCSEVKNYGNKLKYMCTLCSTFAQKRDNVQSFGRF